MIFRLRSCAAFAAILLASGCGLSLPGSIDKSSKADAPAPEPAAERPLASYLHDLSPVIEGVTAETAVLEHLRIPTRSGAVLDGWIRRPDVEGKVPVVIVFTPYYGGGDPDSPANVLGETGSTYAKFLIPHGYAVGHVSVGGTGNSTGCFRDGGEVERQQLYDAVEYVAAQDWSNGNVGTMGVSYDGTTSNELFVDPPPSLKTVVPMEAITDYYRYSFNNGMRRGTNSLFSAYYYAIVGAGPAGLNGGVGPTDPVNFLQELAGEPCADQLFIQANGLYSFFTGDHHPAYWYERDAIRLVNESLDRPRPPMFWIEGLQDANVDPQHSDGWLEAVKATGVPMKIWFGQWVHANPQPSSGVCGDLEPCRGDFFEQALLAWYDQWLKGVDTGILDAPMMQTQADDGVWRHENSWPGDEVTNVDLYAADGALAEAPGSGEASYTDDMLSLQPGTSVEFVSAPLEKRLRLTGKPQIHTVATADAAHAGLVATLLEQFPDGTRRYVNFAAQSLNHAENLEAGDLDITDEPIKVATNFFPQDNVIQPGSQLVLVIGGTVAAAGVPVGSDSSNFLTGGPNLMPIGMGANVSIDLARTRITLPVNAGDRVEPISWMTVAP